MNTKKAMKKCNVRYFSSLSIKQKCNSIQNIRIIKNNLIGLKKGLAEHILKMRDFDVVIKENEFIDSHLKGSKMFFYNKLNCWLPLNNTEIYKN